MSFSVHIKLGLQAIQCPLPTLPEAPWPQAWPHPTTRNPRAGEAVLGSAVPTDALTVGEAHGGGGAAVLVLDHLLAVAQGTGPWGGTGVGFRDSISPTPPLQSRHVHF